MVNESVGNFLVTGARWRLVSTSSYFSNKSFKVFNCQDSLEVFYSFWWLVNWTNLIVDEQRGHQQKKTSAYHFWHTLLLLSQKGVIVKCFKDIFPRECSLAMKHCHIIELYDAKEILKNKKDTMQMSSNRLFRLLLWF